MREHRGLLDGAVDTHVDQAILHDAADARAERQFAQIVRMAEHALLSETLWILAPKRENPRALQPADDEGHGEHAGSDSPAPAGAAGRIVLIIWRIAHDRRGVGCSAPADGL